MMSCINKKAQITLFIIIGIVVVAGIILFFVFYETAGPGAPDVLDIPDIEEQPQENIEHCIKLATEESANLLIEKGGYITKSFLNVTFIYPKGYYLQGIFEDVPYLCYTPRYKTRCIPRESMLIKHLQNELAIDLKPKIEKCFDNFKEELERKGYSVSIDEDYVGKLELVPKGVRIDIERNIVMRKGEISKTFTEFKSGADTRIYDFGIVIQEIISEEARYCNSDYFRIMRYHNWVSIKPSKTQDNIKIYTVKDGNTEQEWMFAVRGCVLQVPS